MISVYSHKLLNALMLVLLLLCNDTQAASPDTGIWAEAQISEAKPYVQQTLIYLIMVVSKVSLERVEHSPPSVSGGMLDRLDEQPLNYPFNMDGRRYNITAFRYAFTPLTLGDITIPSAQVNVVTGSSGPFAWPGKAAGTTMTLETNTIHLEIRPPVANGQKSWLPLAALDISGQLEKPSVSKVGEPLTLSLTLSAQGAAGDQLPSLEKMLHSNAFKLYPERPQTSKEVVRDGNVFTLAGQRMETYTLIPQQSGDIQLPTLRVHWWNVRKNKAMLAEWKPPVIHVGADAPRVSVESQEQNPLAVSNFYFWAVTAAITMFIVGWWTGAGYPGGDILRHWISSASTTIQAWWIQSWQHSKAQFGQQWQHVKTQTARYLPANLVAKGAQQWLRDALIPEGVRMFFSLRRMDTCQEPATCAAYLQDFAHHYLGLRRRTALPEIARALSRSYPQLEPQTVCNVCHDLESALYAPGDEQAASFDVEAWKDDFRSLCQLLPFQTRQRARSRFSGLPPLNPGIVGEA